ncbi:tyrosine-type recombinase/integrase [Vibrio parahaemolyticus]|uniref:tyrosine-type recombinase/integrase n=1 Tax=Vibrio parahaemolyticus TaxID=670 RepID=UPI003D7CA453
MASLIQQSKNEFLLGEFKQAPAVSAWAAILPKRLNQEPWRLHDLRRTISSHLNDAGIEPHIIEAILGHSIRGVAGVYNRAQYLEQKRKALDLWLAKLNETEHHSNVRAIR